MTEQEKTYGNHKENIRYLANKPELLDLYIKLCLEGKQSFYINSDRPLYPEELEKVLKIILDIRKKQ